MVAAPSERAGHPAQPPANNNRTNVHITHKMQRSSNTHAPHSDTHSKREATRHAEADTHRRKRQGTKNKRTNVRE